MLKQSVPGRVRVIALAFGVWTVSASALHGQISVDELEVFLRPGSSGASVGTIRVTNDSDKSVQAFVTIEDWDRDETGGNRFHASGTLPSSCRERLKVFPMTLRIEPRRSETLRVSIEGADTAAACWGIAFVQASEPRAELKRSGISYVIRTGVKVYVEPANAARDGVIEDVRIAEIRRPREPQSTDSLDVREADILFRNIGAAHLKTRGSIELRGSDNTVVGKIDIPEFPSVPGAVRRLKVDLPASLAPGQYVALTLLDYAGQEIAAGQVEFTVK
jgi:P pilus assembly chaperone PapD